VLKGKKRKADDDDKDKDANKKKKKKEEPKPKQAKAKGPVDVEKQCGVLLANAQQCARSLTCKSHSMGAKRAVPGRSLPYDMLLAQYQKKNQARQQSEFWAHLGFKTHTNTFSQKQLLMLMLPSTKKILMPP
jgi:SCA7, zinc-binding domain